MSHPSRLVIEVSDELAGAKLGNPHMKAAIDVIDAQVVCRG
jgi:hypothetical protein